MGSEIFSDFNISGFGNLPVSNSSMPKENKYTLEFTGNPASVLVPLSAIPLTALITHKLSAKNMSGLKNEIKALSKEITILKDSSKKLAQISKQESNTVKNNDAKLWGALAGMAGLAGGYTSGSLSREDKNEIINELQKRVESIAASANTALYDAQKTGAGNSTLINKYTKNINGIKLIDNPASLTKNNKKYNEAVKLIQNTAPKKLYEAPVIKTIESKHPSIWSVTSEFAPIKEGGLGSVPVAIQENVTKLGIDNPSFIPMYQQKGLATLRKEGDEYIYKYGNKMEIKLNKIASFQTDVYRNGDSKTENVEIFMANLEKDPEKKPRQLIFVKNDNYFDGTIYQGGAKNEEPEKFAFFSKAVYEFAKMKMDINSVKNPQIIDRNLFDSVKTPDGLILNDWQSSPISALARYKAPMENAYGQLSDEASKKLSEMSIITIGHNTMYQGSTLNNNDSTQTKEATSNILNTLFDNYTYDIVLNAKTNASETDKTDADLSNLDNVLLTDKDRPGQVHTNLLNMGICLSDYFHPVSENYAKEIISDEHKELSGELRWALTRRNDTGSLIGIINGNDFNKLSIEAKREFIKNSSGLDFEMYNKKSDTDDVIKARETNKKLFYNEYMKPFTKTHEENINDEAVKKVKKLSHGLEFVQESDRKKKLPDLTDEELKQTPIITSVGRLASQKGVDVMCDAIKMLFDNWDKDFPNKPKPIFYIGGQDAEKGKQRNFVQKLQDEELTKEDASRVIFAHGMAPMTTMAAASDFFLLPSNFEPCGLTQSEAFAVGTPVIGSSVGGIVDTVNRNGKTNGILTKKAPKLTAQNFYEAMKKGLDIYFNDRNQYKKMVNDSLQEDFSWIQEGKKGPVFDYLKSIGVNTQNLPEIL